MLGLAFFLVYLSTCLPAVLPADNGELQLVAWKLGIAHPPGYPLYTIVGFLFTRLFTSPAFALNVLSAILASLTLVIISRTVRLLTQSNVAGVLAATLLGVSTTFWSQATTANIRMPTAFFTALCVYTLVKSLRRSVSPSLNLFAFVFSLGLGHHLSLLFPGIFFISYIITTDRSLVRQPRRWIKPLIVFALGLLVVLYLPLRGVTGGTLADGESMTSLAEPARFFDYISGRGFEGDFFYFITTRPDLLPDRVSLLPALFTFQFHPLVLLFVALCAIRLIWKDRQLALMLIGGMALHTFITITYRAPQTVEYMMPAYVLLAIVIGCGIGEFRMQNAECGIIRIPHSAFRIFRWLLVILLLLLIVLQFINHFPSFNWLRQYDDTRAYAESLLNDVPSNAIILSNWHWANPMWYLQQVEGVRPDVTVQYVFPRGEPLAISWLNAIEAGLKANRPVVVNMLFRNEFNNSPYQACLAPCSVPPQSVPEVKRSGIDSFASSDIDFDNQFRVIGYRLLNQATRPGEPLTLFVAYRVEAQSPRNLSFFAHLVKLDGSVIGQADQTVATARYHVGDVIVERFFVAPLRSVEPGEYTLMIGAYTVGNDGRIEPLKSAGNERVPLTTITVEADSHLIRPSGIDLSGGITFVGASASATGEVHPGDRLTLDLKFAAARPILRDYVMSVQINGQGWRVIDDSVPALGAIPTLKWIAGSEIVDRHVLTLPPNASGQATVTLSLYDAFTQEPLALLDAELIKQGPTIPLGTYNVTR